MRPASSNGCCPSSASPNPPWTLHNTVADHARLRPADQSPRIDYAKPDGQLEL